jgi:hypothetical protein
VPIAFRQDCSELDSSEKRLATRYLNLDSVVCARSQSICLINAVVSIGRLRKFQELLQLTKLVTVFEVNNTAAAVVATFSN